MITEVITTDGPAFTAATEVSTKTTLDSRNNILWSEGNEVSLFVGSTINEEYKAMTLSTSMFQAISRSEVHAMPAKDYEGSNIGKSCPV